VGAAGDTETILEEVGERVHPEGPIEAVTDKETLPQAGEHIAEVACATNNDVCGRLPKIP
jgi:hypothetical protein